MISVLCDDSDNVIIPVLGDDSDAQLSVLGAT